VRLFVGIELDTAVRSEAAAIAEALRLRVGRRVTARWIAAGNLHITLWFIGEVADDRAAAILTAIDRPFDIAPFDLHIAGLGAFPPTGAPRVFWLGVRHGGESLARLHGELAVRLTPLGIEPERRPYSAHLTIARVKPGWKDVHPSAGGYGDLRAALRELAADAGACPIKEVTVFRSRLSPKGAAYEAVLRVPLR
jgi:2'-5' RNA ligase